ncbi:MAG: hypothetical protein HWN65_22835 [Candidatus Helarchaeota archaeon]|nr:hypothetical protein [Candidatus Helarchaeota archaeon]
MHSERKAVLYSIGIESSTGGQYGPIFEDKSFIYIPIPDFTREYFTDLLGSPNLSEPQRTLLKNYLNPKITLSYREIPAIKSNGKRTGKVLADFLKETLWSAYMVDLFTQEWTGTKYSAKLSDWIPHFDPEFESYTYGEGSYNKAKTISELKKGDVLIFYASLKPVRREGPIKKYIIGYFIIEAIYNYKVSCGGTPLDYANVPDRIAKNGHVVFIDPEPVIAVGAPQESHLLHTAIPFTDQEFQVYPELADFIPWDYPTRRIPRGVRKFGSEAQAQNWLRVLTYQGPPNLYKRNIYE